ncbi:MAG: quinoprotein relay system zinc metallohydrolase 2 [Xanthobacteraceae bacterium]
MRDLVGSASMEGGLSRRGMLALAAAVLVPSAPVAAAVPPLALESVADGVFVFRAPFELAGHDNAGAIANMSLVVGREAALVIDTGNSFRAGAQMLAAARAVTDRPVRYVVNTHMHPDHVLGNAAFADEATRFIGHAKLPRALAQRADTYMQQAQRLLDPAAFEGTRIILPQQTVESSLRLDLGGRVLILEAQPTAHTDNDLTIFDEMTGTWFLGDLLFMGHVPTLDGSLEGWLRLLGAAEARKAARVVPGHGPASAAWPAAMAAERAYFVALRTDVRRLLAQGRSMTEAAAEAGREQAGDWALFDEFNARNAIAAYHEYEWE